ncbi:hypothetical protein CEP51_011755 [Fusarium floridanum]|uniref:Heterokaryon incompatibility domain-containing protein n=1 Tax=Fusarium floridanum TaxID=1325733 RepID=A0A428R7K2_9HYPO|nr:hypothetical protein CEP51_011755 [Fusarium floridanum]
MGKMTVRSDYLLAFLDELPPKPDETDVKNIWNGRVFPLVLTDDFTANWTPISDPNGLFETPSGERCRVEPKPHHIDRLQLLAQGGLTPTAQRAVYEAIIFGKAACKRTVERGREEPLQLARRRFVDLVETKFPIEWRELIIQRDIHDYNEKHSSQPSSSEARVYSFLAHPKNIRLLTLLPSPKVSAPIQCTLHEVDHQSTPSYEALSYVWGTSPSRRSILLNGGEFSVGENLGAALRQLRPRDGQGRTFWIDAICINQNNPQEKAHQVAQMDSIYKNASGVVVWLGHESNTSSEVFDELGRSKDLLEKSDDPFLSDIPIFQSFNFGYRCCVHTARSWLGSVPPDFFEKSGSEISEQTAVDLARRWRGGYIGSQLCANLSADHFRDLQTLLCRPWWTRVWVLQEAILAKKITLYCGQRHVDWTLFRVYLFLLMASANGSVPRPSELSKNGFRVPMVQWEFVASAQQTFIFFFMQRASGYAHKIPGLSLANFLSLTIEFAATDPRDRLFALVSLLPDDSSERLALWPDYVLKKRRLYIKTAKHFLETTNSLEVITARPLSTDLSPGDVTLPSWAPNWGAGYCWLLSSVWINDFIPFKAMSLLNEAEKIEEGKGSASQPPRDKMQLFNASLFDVSPFAFEFSAWDEILGVRGQPVDIIEEVGPVWDTLRVSHELNAAGYSNKDLNLHHPLPASSIFQAWKSIALAHHEATYPFTNQPRLEVFWRTIFMDRYHPTPQTDLFHLKRLPTVLSPENVAQVFDAWDIGCPFPPNTPYEEHLVMHYLEAETIQFFQWKINVHCGFSRLFRTKKGYIGLGNPSTQPGDEVAILFGAPVPIVLREFKEGYVIIGTSYVHGIMDGEIIQDLRDHGKGMDETDYKLFKII